jgi:hypothetical protein
MIDGLESHSEIEVAIGVLMGLRGCPQKEAVSEFISAVDETGLSPAELGHALVDLASGVAHRRTARRHSIGGATCWR